MASKKYIGVIGDMNPIEHRGGIIFDQGYGPQMTYFQSYEDEDEDMVSVYTFDIEKDVLKDLNWVDWDSVADSTGMDVDELKGHAVSDNVLARASVYESVAGYYGFQNLDSDPQEMTLKAAERKFGRAVDAAHKAQSKKPKATRANNPDGQGRASNPSGEPSPKQWRGYFAMHGESFGPSANDGYNLDKYGITSEQYRALLKIAEGAAGVDATRVTKAQMQKLLRGEKVLMSRADPRDIERVRQAFGDGKRRNNPGPTTASANDLVRKLKF